ncbi:hypothetical protein MIN45_P1958 [Methylomarinovum tepidoasis]|uniref:Methyltransferase domain-containing protein n=1 Tax=Methylomarinovum tepidoasis TaxID=2840183 RepID=A0AAU9C0I3_9GAMM|nr:class I SAM-dependent methyltransferase [Methylomarinovum sp. IN45]BCX89585.1 hypothetical protein MIN45_P1958 [Methylomarinovum sp. IN45]
MFCCAHDQAAAAVFSRLAFWYRQRYRWLGLERTQRQLVVGLAKFGYQDARLLEIGCGVGWLHQWLLRHGAASAVGVDLSPRMLAEAEALARTYRLERRVRYLGGDFLDLADRIEAADIVLLDKVICCYPDATALLRQAIAKAERAVALTYPRRHRLNRLLHGGLNRLLAWLGSDFRTYLHDPAVVERLFLEREWEKRFEAKTVSWLTQVFVQVKVSGTRRG